MSAFVLDCSVTMAWVFPDEATARTDRLRDALADGRAYVPALWPVEVANVLLIATRRGRVGREEWPQIRKSLEALPIDVDSVSLQNALGASIDLAHENNLSVYDAMYLELAVRMHLPLATLDRSLGAAGKAMGVDVPLFA